ncbi:hypothetical protein NDU88_002380 [Pleurodeles waltl]|uniref:Uncharacterized protein n=1 Tax=Pleurodeles waltl TaxID=8319 RepID=A0AAV7UYP5_PLEWA|nr:hypothetical protein NDU88_002380 [Pleurodeles waltl]
MVDTNQAVREALRVLYEAGREDFLQPEVLSQVWVGITRPKRSAASRVTPTVLECLQQHRIREKIAAEGQPKEAVMVPVLESAQALTSVEPEAAGGCGRAQVCGRAGKHSSSMKRQPPVSSNFRRLARAALAPPTQSAEAVLGQQVAVGASVSCQMLALVTSP